MKKLTITTLAVVLLAACATNNEEQLKKRAGELCRYIPDHELREEAREYMTADFYAVLDTMFNYLPEFEAMDHEWLYYFVTGNGGTIADYTVTAVEMTDKDHAVATISVRQQWEEENVLMRECENALVEDGDSASMRECGNAEVDDVEEHKLYMERVDGRWLMSDFDGHKADCIRHIAISRDEQARRDAIGDYLVNEIGEQYQKGEICIPTIAVVASDEARSDASMRNCGSDTNAITQSHDNAIVNVLCDCWVFWYTPSGDTLKCVSGGNHSGLMSLELKDGKYRVSSFEQTADGAGWEPSARRIFGSYYDVYQNIHSNQGVREAVRREQLRHYLKRHGLRYRYYQDYGWPAVEL